MATIILSRQELKTIASGLHKLGKKLETNMRRKPWEPSLGARDLASENLVRINALIEKIKSAIASESEDNDAGD